MLNRVSILKNTIVFQFKTNDTNYVNKTETKSLFTIKKRKNHVNLTRQLTPIIRLEIDVPVNQEDQPNNHLLVISGTDCVINTINTAQEYNDTIDKYLNN